MRITASLLLSLCLLPACDGGETATTAPEAAPEAPAAEGAGADGKQDTTPTQVGFIKSVELLEHEVVDGEKETFYITAEVADAFYDDAVDGETLKVEMWLLDGDANPEFKINTTLTYHVDGAGAFVSDLVDASDFLPWNTMKMRLTGERGYDDFVFTYGNDLGQVTVEPMDTGVCMVDAECGAGEACVDAACVAMAPETIKLVAGLEMISHEEIDGEKETIELVAYPSDEFYNTLEDGHVLQISLWASDGASNHDYKIPGALVFHVDGVGAYISGTLDTSDLLPWGQMTVEITGELNGESVHQQFVFTPGNFTAAEITVEAPVVEPVEMIKEVEVVGFESDGERAALLITGEVTEMYYDALLGGETLSLELWAADGASNPDYKIQAAMTYNPDGVGAFISDVIDVSDLIPFRALGVRVHGEYAGQPVDQTFTLTQD
ncbi:MAG: hypothetical protein ACE366_08170 [Bradymonadia bacterium]